MEEINTSKQAAITCPNCGHRFSDSEDFIEDSHREQEVICHADCGATFSLNIDFKVYYTTKLKG